MADLLNSLIEAAGRWQGGGTMIVVFFMFFCYVLLCDCGMKPLALNPPLVNFDFKLHK
jgi:hypothetical protein